MTTADELRERIAGLDETRRKQLLARVMYEREARRTMWLCENPNCKGDPHKSAPFKHARPAQRLPFKAGDGILGCLAMAGRGWGKTRFGAEGVRLRVDKGLAGRVAIIARTPADARDTMIEGESGILAIYPRWQRPEYQPSKRRVIFHNGAIGTVYSAQEPDQLRGPQHHLAWVDEVSTFPNMFNVNRETNKPTEGSVLTNALLGLRLPVVGDSPRIILTGTPKPTVDMRYLVAMKNLLVITGTTYENLANLDNEFRGLVVDLYEGTRLGKQELLGELLKDVEGALLNWGHFEWQGFRTNVPQTEITSVVVAVDPAVSTSTKSDFTGISVVAADVDRRHGYVLHSERVKLSPEKAMERAATIYDTYHANYIVGEVNNGGQYVSTVLRQLRPDIPFKSVHASVGKTARAEPVTALYEQKRMHHIGEPDAHLILEDELTSWVPGESTYSPDVLDSMVWGATELMVRSTRVVGRPYRTRG